VLACHKLNVARKPPSLKFASTVVAIPAVERLPDEVGRAPASSGSKCVAVAFWMS
jgi:hypothetical protein